MKKSLFLAAALCGSMAANATLSDKDLAGNNYVQEWGRLKLVGNQLSSEDGKPVQLKGWSTFSINYGEVQKCLTQSAWDAMKLWGANIVRIAIYPSNASGSYSQSQDNKIMDYIRWCNDRGMYALVDWHVLDCDNGAGSGNPAAKQNEAKGMFKRISEKVKSEGLKNVLYEICNEPSGVSWDNIKTYADQVLPVIEAGDPGAVVIVGTPNWDQEIGQAVNSPIPASRYRLNLMYAFHFYACSHGYMTSRMVDASASIPVFISEWGAVAFDGNGSFCEGESNKFLGFLQKEGGNGNQLISWCYWAWGEKDETSNCIVPGKCGSNYNADVLSKSGKYIVSVLTGNADIPTVPQAESYEVQNIPTFGENYASFNIGYYDNGGQDVAYNDCNSSMYKDIVDSKGTKTKDRSCDGVTDKSCIDPTGVEAICINAGAYYADWEGKKVYDGFFRYDEGVDVTHNCAGIYADYGADRDGFGTTDLHNLCMTEPGEWAKYTIKVTKPGYYKMHVLTTTNTSSEGSIGLAITGGKKPGQNGNILRSAQYFNDEDEIDAYVGISLNPCKGFVGRMPDGTIMPNKSSEDREANGKEYLAWGWMMPGAKSDQKDIRALFKYEGEQKLMLRISPDDAGTPGDFSNILFEFDEEMNEIPEFEFQDRVQEDGVENLVANMDEVAVYPNPSNGNFTVAVAGASNVTVYNAVGAVVFNQDVENNVEVNGLGTGIYTVRVSCAAGVKTMKAIVK